MSSRTAKLVPRLRAGRSLVRQWLSDRPALYYPLLELRSRGSHLAVRPNTQLVVEGFPRSGNTFTVAWLQESNPDLRIAHHLHAFAQVRRGIAWNIPVLILIREPTAAVTSLLVREPTTDPLLALSAYLSFYRNTLDARDSVVVAPFEDVISCLGSVMESVNLRYGTAFPNETPDQEATERVFRKIQTLNEATGAASGEHGVARPSAARQVAKVAAEARLRAPRERRLLLEATRVHQILVRDAPRLGPRQ